MNKKPVILLVDDEALAIHVLKRSLSLKFETLTAESYHEALDIMEKRDDIDAVVTDYLMPVKTGVDLLRYLRAEKPDVHRAVITGCVDEVLNEEKKSGLIEAIIEKPTRDTRIVTSLIENMVLGVCSSDC